MHTHTDPVRRAARSTSAGRAAARRTSPPGSAPSFSAPVALVSPRRRLPVAPRSRCDVHARFTPECGAQREKGALYGKRCKMHTFGDASHAQARQMTRGKRPAPARHASPRRPAPRPAPKLAQRCSGAHRGDGGGALSTCRRAPRRPEATFLRRSFRQTREPDTARLAFFFFLTNQPLPQGRGCPSFSFTARPQPQSAAPYPLTQAVPSQPTRHTDYRNILAARAGTPTARKHGGAALAGDSQRTLVWLSCNAGALGPWLLARSGSSVRTRYFLSARCRSVGAERPWRTARVMATRSSRGGGSASAGCVRVPRRRGGVPAAGGGVCGAAGERKRAAWRANSPPAAAAPHTRRGPCGAADAHGA